MLVGGKAYNLLGGDTVGYITFALISLLIVFPVVYFLPIGISVKGKLCLIGIAFLIANIGLLSNSLFELWQSSLILFLLVLLCSFIFDRRYRAVLNTEQYSFKQQEGINLTKEAQLSEKIDEEEKNIILDDDLINSDEDLQSLTAIDEHNNEENFERIEDIEPLHEELKLDKTFTESVQKEDSFEIDEDISFLLNRNEALNTGEAIESSLVVEKEENIQEVGYMSEIEKLLEETSIELEANSVYTQIEENKEMENLEEIVINKNNSETKIDEKTAISNEEVEIEELVFQK